MPKTNLGKRLCDLATNASALGLVVNWHSYGKKRNHYRFRLTPGSFYTDGYIFEAVGLTQAEAYVAGYWRGRDTGHNIAREYSQVLYLMGWEENRKAIMEMLANINGQPGVETYSDKRPIDYLLVKGGGKSDKQPHIPFGWDKV